MTLLSSSYRRDNLQRVMCRDLVSVDYRGYVHDCDFNQCWACRWPARRSTRSCPTC